MIFNVFNIDSIIIALYLVVTLIVGFVSGRRIYNIRDYAVSHSSFSLTIITLSLIATILGGTSTLGMMADIYSAGVIMLVAATGYVMSYFFVIVYIAPHMSKFANCISIGDIMQISYGKSGKIVSGIIGIIFCAGILIAQFKALSYVLSTTLGMESNWFNIVVSLVLICYSAFGGIKSVTATDVIQFIILIVIIPIVANLSSFKVGGIATLLSSIPETHWQVFQHPKLIEYTVIWLVWGVFPAFLLSPPFLQRMLMMRSGRKIANAFTVAAIITVPFELMIGVIAFSALMLFPGLEPGTVFPTMIMQFLPTVLTGLAIVGVLAVIMSTADSFLNSISVMVAHDVIAPIFGSGYRFSELKIAKYTTVIIGLIVIYLSTGVENIVRIEFVAASIFGPTIVVPLIAAIMQKEVTKKALFSAIIAGVLGFAISAIVLPEHLEYLSSLIAIVSNIVVFLWVCGAFTIDGERRVLRGAINRLIHAERLLLRKTLALISYLHPATLINYSARSVEKYGASYTLFSVFYCINFVLPYFMWPYQDVVNMPLVIVLRVTCGALCFMLLFREYLSQSLQKVFPLYWHFVLLCCLPFSTTLLFLLHNGQIEWLLNLAFSTVLMLALVDWLTFIVLSVLGAVLGYLAYYFMVADVYLVFDYKTKYYSVYAFVFSLLIGLLFVRKKERDIESRVNAAKIMSNSMAHELNSPMAAVKMSADTLLNVLASDEIAVSDLTVNGKKVCRLDIQYEDYKVIKEIIQQLQVLPQRSINIVNRFLMSAYNEIPVQHKEWCSMVECIREAISDYGMRDFDLQRINIVLKEDDCMFYGSRAFMKNVVFNLLKNFFQHAGSNASLNIIVDKNKVVFEDNGVGIVKSNISNVFQKFFTSTNTNAGLGLSFCKMVMGDIGGKIDCEAQRSKYTKITLHFPYVASLNKEFDMATL